MACYYISYVEQIIKKWQIIYSTTYHFPCLIEYKDMISDEITYHIASPTGI